MFEAVAPNEKVLTTFPFRLELLVGSLVRWMVRSLARIAWMVIERVVPSDAGWLAIQSAARRRRPLFVGVQRVN